MYEFHGSEGFDIIDLGNDQYIFDVKNVQKYHGTLKELIKFAINKYNFNIDEIEYGLMIMNSLGHNCCHFGSVYKTFIFSKNIEINLDKSAA